MKIGNPLAFEKLNPHVEKLNSNVAQLKTLASQGDVEAYSTFMKETLDYDLKELRQEITDVRTSTARNITRDSKTKQRMDYKMLSDELKVCELNAIKQFGTSKVRAYNAHLSAAENKIAALKEKGIETSGLDALVSGAKSEIIAPLEDALSKAQTGEEVRTALHSLCLYDSCKTGVNYHFAAKFEAEKLTQILNHLNSKTNLTAEQVSSIVAKIKSASDELVAVGTKQYSEEQKKTVWDGLKAAAKEMRELKPARTEKREGDAQ
jgi:hypothetical protein